jgi:hypothetical protein
MAVFWLTFRLHEAKISGKSYEERYKALYAVIDNVSTQWWIETTSFIAFESAEGISTIAARCKRAIAPSHDVVLIRLMDTKTAYLVGTAEDHTIYQLMPYLKNA